MTGQQVVRNIIISFIVLALGIAVVYAQDVIVGKGTLTADGDGIIALNGSGEVVISGKGELFIVDRTHEATIDIDSKKRLRHRERVTRDNIVHTFRRFDGTATIQGEDIAVVMDGINISLSISGTGMILIEGEGNYTIQNETISWSDNGSMIALNQESD